MLAQSVRDLEHSPKFHRFPEELFQTLETAETVITKIFRSAFDADFESRKYYSVFFRSS